MEALCAPSSSSKLTVLSLSLSPATHLINMWNPAPVLFSSEARDGKAQTLDSLPRTTSTDGRPHCSPADGHDSQERNDEWSKE